MPSAPACEPQNVSHLANTDALLCARYLPAKVLCQPCAPPPSRFRLPPPTLLCSIAQSSCLASPLRTSLPAQQHQPRPKPPGPLPRASLLPAILLGHNGLPAAERFPFPAAARPTHQPFAHQQRKPVPACSARSVRLIRPDCCPPPAPPRQTARRESPPRRASAFRSNRSNPRWQVASRNE